MTWWIWMLIAIGVLIVVFVVGAALCWRSRPADLYGQRFPWS